MRSPRVPALLVVACAALAAGCKKEPTPGERLDEAIDKTGDVFKDIQEDAVKTLDDAEEKMKEK